MFHVKDQEHSMSNDLGVHALAIHSTRCWLWSPGKYQLYVAFLKDIAWLLCKKKAAETTF